MNEMRSDPVTMIGLHRLAADVDGGLVPELYAVLADRPRVLAASENVVPFPVGQASLPRRSLHAIPAIARARDGDTILLFPQPSLPSSVESFSVVEGM